MTLNTTVEEQESELKEMHTWHNNSLEMVDRETIMEELEDKFNDHMQNAINECFKRIEEKIDQSINDKIINI